MAEMAGFRTNDKYSSVGTCLVLRWRQLLRLTYPQFGRKSQQSGIVVLTQETAMQFPCVAQQKSAEEVVELCDFHVGQSRHTCTCAGNSTRGGPI